MTDTVRRILEVTDEDETLALEYVNLDDLRTERILPVNFGQPSATEM